MGPSRAALSEISEKAKNIETTQLFFNSFCLLGSLSGVLRAVLEASGGVLEASWAV